MAPFTAGSGVYRSSKNRSPTASLKVSATTRFDRVVIMRAAETMKVCEPPSRWNHRARRHISRAMRFRTRACNHRPAGSASWYSSSASTSARRRSSRAYRAMPTRSFDSASRITCQPFPGSPRISDPSTQTSSKKTSVRWWGPGIPSRPRTVIPSRSIGSRKTVTPSRRLVLSPTPSIRARR